MGTEIPTLEAEPRDLLGKRNTARLRKQGKLPAVVYGHKQDPVHVSIDGNKLTEILHHEAHLLELSVGGKTEHCLVKDVQWDHLGDSLIHADFSRVDLKEEVEVDVEVHLIGDAVGLKESGAYLEHAAASIAVKCQAGNIPDHITADISELSVGKPFTVADVELPTDVVAVSDPEMIIAAIHITKAEEEAEAVEGEAGSEPEVIKKEKPQEPADDK